MEKQLRLSGVAKQSIVDGKGIRYTIFTQGCPHYCKGCHNEQTHDFSGGYDQTIEGIIQDIKSNPLICGVTLSGGEPFCQAEQLIELVQEVKKLGKNVWAYSGYTYEELSNNIQPYSSDLLNLVDVLVDGKFELDKRDLTLLFRGSSNQRIIDCNATRIQKNVTLFL